MHQGNLLGKSGSSVYSCPSRASWFRDLDCYSHTHPCFVVRSISSNIHPCFEPRSKSQLIYTRTSLFQVSIDIILCTPVSSVQRHRDRFLAHSLSFLKFQTNRSQCLAPELTVSSAGLARPISWTNKHVSLTKTHQKLICTCKEPSSHTTTPPKLYHTTRHPHLHAYVARHRGCHAAPLCVPLDFALFSSRVHCVVCQCRTTCCVERVFSL